MRQISVEDAARWLSDPGAPQLLDCREPFEVAIAALPGAVHIPMMETLDRATAELDRDRPVLVYCHHGVRSVNVAMMLEGLGFRADSMRGGIDQWSLRVDPRLPRY